MIWHGTGSDNETSLLPQWAFQLQPYCFKAWQHTLKTLNKFYKHNSSCEQPSLPLDQTAPPPHPPGPSAPFASHSLFVNSEILLVRHLQGSACYNISKPLYSLLVMHPPPTHPHTYPQRIRDACGADPVALGQVRAYEPAVLSWSAEHLEG